ncbi:hypothetical protein [Nonomuraea lactucae]|uniref:hypothetical protein n=1 Tax=Nonomuraea lactucae TaxID=2249762 RepID=UPI000DE38F08|nr:hypothetical protein [Nonomuraea lactucae]
MAKRALFRVAAALCAALALALGTAVVGLDAADKLASVLGLVVALAGLAVSLRGMARTRTRESEATVDRLTGTEAVSLVNAMGGDNWRQAEVALLRLWRDTLPDRLPDVEAALVETRRELSAARPDTAPAVHDELVSEWQGRLRRHALADPAFAAALRRLIAEKIAPLTPQAPPRSPRIEMNATGYDRARIQQSAGDMYINQQND